jgi:NAD(P)-dependent dehydrogenase (short-subunit alcohol dehydrogenase family)
MRLADKVALVTGGGSGIGRETSVLFAREGARIVVSDVGDAAAQETAVAVAAVGGAATVVTGDVSVTDEAKAMVDTALEAYGKLDILINSAGVTQRNATGPDATPEETWDRVIEVNLKGTYLVSWHAVPEMQRRGGGSIVNLASIIAVVGYPSDIPALTGGFNPYPASKGGVLQFTRNLAMACAADNIRVNCICPGYTETNMTATLTDDPELYEALVRKHPIGRLGRAEDIAYAALYLASDESSFVTGAPIMVDGGYTAQ